MNSYKVLPIKLCQDGIENLLAVFFAIMRSAGDVLGPQIGNTRAVVRASTSRHSAAYSP